MTRPKAPKLQIAREHLPPHVQEHVPEDLEDALLPFWWAAFARGWEAALQPTHVPDLDLGPPVADLRESMTTEANYGDDPIEHTADVVVERTNLAMSMGAAAAPAVDLERLEQALWADQALADWRDGHGGTEQRALEAMVLRALEAAKLIKKDDW